MLYEFEREYSITLTIKPALAADLWIPYHCQGIVIFAHGSGSSRHIPRNRYVARVLQKAGFATLLADLLTKEEETIDEINRSIRFNIILLAEFYEMIIYLKSATA